MKAYRGVEEQLHSFLTMSLDGSQWSVSLPGSFPSREEARYSSKRRLGAPQNRSGHSGTRKIILPLSRVAQPVAKFRTDHGIPSLR